jgi:hypothetical protein
MKPQQVQPFDRRELTEHRIAPTNRATTTPGDVGVHLEIVVLLIKASCVPDRNLAFNTD